MQEYGVLDVDMRLKRLGRRYRYITFFVRLKDYQQMIECGTAEDDYFREELPGQIEIFQK